MTNGSEPHKVLHERLIACVHGRVQGVWFRGTCCEQARRLGVSGWIRNRHDGRVEAVFEGRESDVRRMLSWCHRGPRMAQVGEVKVEWGEPAGQPDGFSVRY